MTTSDERGWQALEALYDSNDDLVDAGTLAGYDDRDPDEPVLISEGERERREWTNIFRALNRENLITFHESAGGLRGSSAGITHHGRVAVEERRRVRVDPAERRSRAEQGILQYLHQKDPDGITMTSLQGDDGLRINHAGAILPSKLIGRVAEDLKEAGLIEAGAYVAEYEGPLTARLTSLGLRCIESGESVKEFIDQRRSREPSHVVHIGTVTGNQLSWGDHVTQNSTTTTGLVADEVRQLVQAIVQALPVLEIPEGTADAVRRDAAVVEDELERQTPESRGIVRSMMKRTLDTIRTEGSNPLALYIVTTGKNLLKNAGIELG